MTNDFDGPQIVTTHLLGGPAHGEKLTISSAFATVHVVKGDLRLEYCQQRFVVQKETYILYRWPGLSNAEAEALALEEVCAS